MSKFIAYYRVSTKKQGEQGLGIESQRSIVARYLAGANGKTQLIAEYTEVESGRKSDRVQLQAAISQCLATGATLLVAKLDRLARNVQFMSTLMNSGVNFVACDMPSANRLTIHIMAALAEEEARLISERTKAALEVAKNRGVKLGRPKGSPATNPWHKDPTRRQKQTQERTKDTYKEVLPLIETLRSRGETNQQIADELNARGFTTPKGKQFRASGIYQVLQTLERTCNTN